METIPIEDLLLLDRRLDIFKPKTIPDLILVTEGFYSPLPVSGNALVWGFHILEAAWKGGIRTLTCISIKEGSPAYLVSYALALEARAGDYDWEELERVVVLLGGIGNIDTRLATLLFCDNPKHGIEKLRSYLSLTGEAKALVARYGMDVKTALRTSGLAPETIAALVSNDSFMRFSASEKRIFMEMACEVIKRDMLPRDAQIGLIVNALASNNPRAEIEKKRFPGLYAMHRKLDNFKATKLEGSGIELVSPPLFEGDSFSVSFSFTSAKNFKKKCATLASIGDSVHELFELL
jgi:hypothetical protein